MLSFSALEQQTQIKFCVYEYSYCSSIAAAVSPAQAHAASTEADLSELLPKES